MGRSHCGHRMNRPGRDAWKAALRQRFNGWTGPAANIEDTAAAFILSLYAAGIRKEDVTIRVQDDVLQVHYQPAGGPETVFASQEHPDMPWQRAFQLNGKALTDQISATYTDGVLRITLPKNPETTTPPHSVPVS